jgi:hypothetical protein
LITHLRKKIYYHSAAPTIHLRRPPTCADQKKPSSFNPGKKPFPFNPGEKAVPIQLT